MPLSSLYLYVCMNLHKTEIRRARKVELNLLHNKTFKKVCFSLITKFDQKHKILQPLNQVIRSFSDIGKTLLRQNVSFRITHNDNQLV